METSETVHDKNAQRNHLREIFGVFFGTPGRSAATSAAALFLVVVGYVILLPSGLFDDREFVPTPWEEWNIPGDPPTERPLITKWFGQSPIWQEAERLSAMPGVEEAVIWMPVSEERLSENDKLSEEDFSKAMALLQARAEAGVEFAKVAPHYSLGSMMEPSVGSYFRASNAVQAISRSLDILTRMALIGEHTGREAQEWLEHYGEFAASMMPLGESGFISNVVVHHAIAAMFFECVLEWIPSQGDHDSDVVASLRRHLSALERSSIDGIARAAYGEAQVGGRSFDERAGPGKAWAAPRETARELAIGFGFLMELPAWLEWLESPANWWAVARVQRNKTKALLEKRCREQVEWLQLPPSERMASAGLEVPDFHEVLGPFSWREFLDPRPNAIGERVLAGYAPEITQRNGRRGLATGTAATMVDIALAMAQWQAAGGGPGLPATLDELVPEFLDGIPIDPFSGRPFGYDAVRGVLWSVGMDGVDTGGKRPEEHGALTSELLEGRSGTLDLWHVFQIEPDGGAEETE